MAMLAFISSLVLQLTLRVAGALWVSSTINTITGQGAEGFSSQALQQGGVGLLMTVLIISVPPMAAMFFQGTVGNFYFNSAFGAGGGNRQGPNGQMQSGLGGGYGGGGAPQLTTAQSVPSQQVAPTNSINFGQMAGKANVAPTDAIKPANPPRM
jgi:type IV secretion system protein VirB6